MNKINKAVENYHLFSDGEYKCFVCICCDRFVSPSNRTFITSKLIEKNKEFFTVNNFMYCPAEVAKHYDVTTMFGNHEMFKNLLLSPRATMQKHKQGEKFSCCVQCRTYLYKHRISPFFISNGNFVGEAPTCLTELTDIELCFITPVRKFGFIFSYTGGRNQCLKGTLSFFKVETSSIARASSILKAAVTSEKVVFLLTGRMTDQQHYKAMKKSKIRPTFIKNAIKFLCKYNCTWTGVDLEKIDQFVKEGPIVIDKSLTIGEDQNNIESTEVFSVYFPDGNMTKLKGGQSNIEDFHKLIESDKTAKLSNLGFICKLDREIIQDMVEGDNFLFANILQFPYGKGGFNEERVCYEDNSFQPLEETNCFQLIDYYINHSILTFHTSLFVLMCYSMKIKEYMFNKSCIVLRDKQFVEDISTQLTEEKLRCALNQRRLYSTDVEQRFLSAVDTLTRAIPHSNEAARYARGISESIQDYFGNPSIFLTVSPDDTNCFNHLIFDTRENYNEYLASCIPEAADIFYRKTKEFRMNYPGISAIYFDYIIEIISKDIIGWDFNKGESMEGGGIFGVCNAAIIAIEEQGRKSLHMHILVWVEHIQQLMINLSHEKPNNQERNEARLINLVDQHSSCTLMGWLTKCQKDLLFKHQCINKKRASNKLIEAGVQELRNMRHRDSHVFHKGKIVSCKDCFTSWNSEEITCKYLKVINNLIKVNNIPEDLNQLLFLGMKYQYDFNFNMDLCLIDACYNRHSSKHVSSCFRRNKTAKNGKRKRDSPDISLLDECRQRYPRKQCKKTCIVYPDESSIYFHWSGDKENRFFLQIEHERSIYDCFQNVSCPTISKSKLCCNTNISFLSPGPITFYITKYQVKGNQEEEAEEYNKVLEAIKKNASYSDSDMVGSRREAFRRLLKSSYAHNNINIIGAPLASFLLRNESRFLFSVKTIWCPMYDIFSILSKRKVNGSLLATSVGMIFNCNSLHYLCRPECLESVGILEFYTMYEVITCKKKSDNLLPNFIVNEKAQIKHPSCHNGCYKQSLKQRDGIFIPRTQSWRFPDTASFGSSLFEYDPVENAIKEKYCLFALMFFIGFRCLEDLKLNNSYQKMFIKCVEDSTITEKNLTYLQNIQDRLYNNNRCTGKTDIFVPNTTMFKPNIIQFVVDNEDSDWEEEEEAPCVFWDDIDTSEETDNENMLSKITFLEIKKKGAHQCGLNMIAGVTCANTSEPLFEYESNNDFINTTEVEEEGENNQHFRLKQADIVKLISLHESRILNVTDYDVSLTATGSALNIMQWGINNKLDKDQRRAFEIITCSVVLKYFEQATNNIDYSFEGRNSKFNKEHEELKKLYSIHQSDFNNLQLIALIHGPGGSGKSRVIELVLLYGKQFCDNLNQVFNRYTINITALSGVAATLIKGETVHKALFLNSKSTSFHTKENIDLFEQTKLIVIDEISFANRQLIEKIDRNLRLLGKQDELYGGFNIVFAGDFRQLDPLGGDLIYNQTFHEFHEAINCYIELNGMHRFKNNKSWGELLQRFRNGVPTSEDFKSINERVCINVEELPKNIHYATFSNKDRDAINCATFEKFCEQTALSTGNKFVQNAFLITASDLKFKNKNGDFVPLKSKKFFFENCGESSIRMKTKGLGRLDPVLKLYIGCPLMLTSNDCIELGIANGSLVTVDKIVFHDNQMPTTIILNNGITVMKADSNQIKYIRLRHTSCDINPPVFKLEPKKYHIRCKMPGTSSDRALNLKYHHLDMTCVHFNFISNTATTGHKLQGRSVDKLFVHTWSYRSNWVYVVLSRVRDLKGLYIRQPLQHLKTMLKVPKNLTDMLKNFKKLKSPSYDYSVFNRR